MNDRDTFDIFDSEADIRISGRFLKSEHFFNKVWQLVAKIPFARVATYGQIAAALGQPHNARMVGWALSSVPDDLEIPWHRVINSQGRISLPAGSGEAELQRSLLISEGVLFDENGTIDLDIYQWKD